MEEKYYHTIFSTFKRYHFVVTLEIYYLYMFGPLNLDYVCGTLVCWQIIIIDLQFIESSLYNNCVALLWKKHYCDVECFLLIILSNSSAESCF